MDKDSTDSTLVAEAEELKNKGNDFFKDNLLQPAIDYYSKAIEKLGAEHKKCAVYLCNRAFAQIKLENFGCGLTDSESAIVADPTFPKGYYRKSSCLFALGKLDESIKTLEQITKVLKMTNIPDVNERIKFLKQLKKEKEFLECIQYEDELEKCNENEIAVEASYQGPVLNPDTVVDLPWVENLLEFLKKQKKLHKRYLWVMIKRVRAILDKEPNMVSVTVDGTKVREMTVCGDIHGQYYDFLNILKLNGLPSADRPYLFNGDFVDRGSFSVECMIALMAFKIHNPSCLYLNRGNHENPDLNKMYGFEGEVLAKYCATTFALFKSLFYTLPLAHVLNKKVLVLHGGLFEKDGVKLEDIQKVNRKQAIPSSGIMCDMLWADPSFKPGRQRSKRGVSIEFGPDVTARFLEENGLGRLIRVAGPVPPGQGHGVRGRAWPEGHHRLLRPQVLRPDVQQGGLHPLQA